MVDIGLSMRRMPIEFGGLCCALAGLTLALQLQPAVRAMDGEDQTLRMMCEQGLTESAILYATSERERVRANDEAYVRWTMRLIECEAQAALRAEDSAEKHWNRCQEIYDEFKKMYPQSRRLPWIEWQSIRCDLLLAQDKLARWLAAPANSALREQALELVRTILADLGKLEDDLKQRQPLAAKQAANDRSQAPPEQISQLRLDTVLARCEAYLIRARLYESRSRDRVGAAANVEAEAGGLLDRTTKEWPTRASLEVARATAWLDLDRQDEAIALLQSVLLAGRDEAACVRAAVVASEALIEQGQTSQARAFVDRLRDLEGGPEWEITEIRLALRELGQLPSDRKEAEIGKLLAKAKGVGERHGDYWQARVDAILTTSVSSAEVSSSNSTELVLVEVRQLLAGGDEKAAIAKLIASSRNELAAGRKQNAVQFANQAGALLQRQKAWLEAAQAAEEVVKQSPEIEGAATGHLSAAWSLSQALKSNPQDQQLREHYTQVLQDHLRLWPNASTTDQATQWLKDWSLNAGNQEQLLPVLRQLSEQVVAPEKAREAIYTWLGIVLGTPNKRNAEVELIQTALAEGKFQSIDASVRIAALAASVIPAWQDAKATKRMQAELDGLVNAASHRTDRQLLTLMYWLLAARNGEQAVAKSAAASWNPTELPVEMLEPIGMAWIEVVDTWPLNELPDWAMKSPFNEEQLNLLKSSSRFTSQALAFRLQGLEPEKSAESIAGLRELIKRNPKLGTLQLQLSNSLSKGDENARRESTEIARRLAANSPAGSDLYYAARWRVIRNQKLDGKNSDAEKSAKLVMATLAEESTSWRVKFSKLIN